MKYFLINWAKKLGPLIIVLLSMIISGLFIFFKPKAIKENHNEPIPLVETITLTKQNKNITIKTQGFIEPAHVLHVVSEVSGNVIYTNDNFIDGGLVKKGDILVKIDPKNYEVILAQKKSLLAKAKLNLSLETAEHEVAMLELERRKDIINDDAKTLATRDEFLQKAKSEYNASLAELQQAEIMYMKTMIKSPINGIISKVNIHHGEFVNYHHQITTIYGIDEFKAEVNIPIEDLKYLSFAKQNEDYGSKAIISQITINDETITKEGVVSSLLPDLGSLGHMARIIISIKDPLSFRNNQPPLLAKAKVNVNIEGKKINDIFVIPMAAITKDNTVLSIDEASKIVPIKLQIIRRDKDIVYAKGEELDNTKIIVTKTNALIGQEVRATKESTVKYYDN